MTTPDKITTQDLAYLAEEIRGQSKRARQASLAVTAAAGEFVERSQRELQKAQAQNLAIHQNLGLPRDW